MTELLLRLYSHQWYQALEMDLGWKDKSFDWICAHSTNATYMRKRGMI